MNARTYNNTGVFTACPVLDKHNQCLQSSTVTKSDWLRSLRFGCLHKSINDQLKNYSHIKALSCRQLRKPFTSLSNTKKSDEHIIDPMQDYESQMYTLNNDINSTLQSPVIFEDLSKPPEVTTEADLLLFTENEFFQYLWSDKWNEVMCLRVVGGRLLELLLISLYDLESRRLLIGHVLYANLNNRQDAPVHTHESKTEEIIVNFKQDSADSGTLKEKSRPAKKKSMSNNNNQKPLIKVLSNEQSANGPNDDRNNSKDCFLVSNTEQSPEAQKHWNYETMAVRLIFYEKADVSNITCVLASKARNCKLNPIPQDVVLPPLSRVKYRMNDLGIRLPFSENIDTRDRMATLTTEIEELARSPPVCEGIEIFQLNKQKQKDVSNINTKTSEISSKVLTSKISEQFLEFITNDARFSCGKKCEILKSRKTRRRSSCNKTAHPVCSDTFTFIDYPTQEKLCIEEIVESKDKPIYERLNLTREELYISGVYLPRYENRIPITEKLRIARRRRLELRSDVSKSGEVETGKKLKVRTLNKHEPQNKDNQLKHLKLAGTEKVTNEDICERLWNKYMKEQDAMEMQSAINKKLEVNTRKVIKKFNTPPPTSDKSKKQKTKNINVNKSNMSTHGDNSGKNSSISPILPSSSNREEPLSDPSITERIKSRTVSPGIIPSRQSQRSTNFFYVSDFQKPDTRAPSQQSDYERRRSSLIMEHTPYRSKSPEPHITYSKESNKWQDSALIYSKNDAYLLNCKLEHGGISRRSSFKPGSEELAAYSCECPCRECISHKDGLDYIREHCFIGVEDYPPWLGKLRKSFGFLKSRRTEPHVGVVPRKVVSHFVKMDMPEISEELMRLFDHVMIRKEILTSSLGHTYTTITFTKTQG